MSMITSEEASWTALRVQQAPMPRSLRGRSNLPQVTGSNAS